MARSDHKDIRFKTAGILLEAGEITKFSGIFRIVPKTIFARELKTNNSRITLMIKDPSRFTLKDLYALADLMKYDREKLVLLAAKELEGKLIKFK